MNISYQEEAWQDFLPDFKLALPLHFAETDPEYPFDPDYETFGLLDEAGLVKCATLRIDGQLAGYAVIVTTPNYACKSQIISKIDFFWVHEAARGEGAGKALFKFTEQLAVEAGANRLMTACKVRLASGKIFEDLGFTFYERVYDKRIGATQ